MSLRTVYQSRETDCGAAAVAMLCCCSLEEAYEAVYRDRNIGITSSGRLLDAIREFGGVPLSDRCRARGETDLTELQHDALLKSGMIINGKETTHWCVWDCESQAVRDPYGYWFPINITHLVEISWPD